MYHNAPSEEDLYTLFHNGAKLIGRNVSSCIYLPERRRFKIKRRESVTKAKNHGLTVRQCFDFEGFMGMVNQVVAGRLSYNSTIMALELAFLASRFPNNIKLFWVLFRRSDFGWMFDL